MVELLEAWCFKGAKKIIFLFFCFWFVLLFCRLLWNNLSELVSMMECNLAAQWILFMTCVNHGSASGLVRNFQGSEGMGRREIYMMLTKMKVVGLKLNF
jgi:hypothetical protein